MTRDDPILPPEDHTARVREAFDSLHERVAQRLDPEARESIQRLRDAAAEKNADEMRERLADVKERHGWLYRELAEHPKIALLLDELALWGF